MGFNSGLKGLIYPVVKKRSFSSD